MGNLVERGKELAYLLRHDTHYEFDEHGWRSVQDLIDNHGYTMEELHEIVETNNKKRYEFSPDLERIRARQGHSVPVDVELEEVEPPQILWHGTSADSLRSIKESGIDKRTRLYVHLSDSVFQAQAVGKRHGIPIVLGVMAGAMFDAGYKFYRSRNGVWLTDYVPPQYIWVRNTHY